MLLESISPYSACLYRHKITYFDRPLMTNLAYSYELVAVMNPANIYIKIMDDETAKHEKQLEEVLKAFPEVVPINKVYRLPHDKIYSGMPVIVKMDKNDSNSCVLARGEVEVVENDTATVTLIDDGVVEVIPVKNLLPVTVEVLRVPRIAYRVHLSQASPPYEGSWPIEACNKEHYTGGKVQTATFLDYFPNSKVYSAVLQKDGVNVGVKFFHQGWAIPTPLESHKPNGDVFPVNNYNPWIGTKMIAFAVRGFLDPVDNRLKCVLHLNPEAIEKIQSMISVHLQDPLYAKKNPISFIMPGFCCLAKYGQDEYFRAIIRKIVNKDNIEIEYVDYKETGKVTVDDLLKCPPELMNEPEAAVICGLTDFVFNKLKDHDQFIEMTTNKDVYAIIDASDPNLLGSEILVSLFEPVEYGSGLDISFHEKLGMQNKPVELRDIISPLNDSPRDVCNLFLKSTYPPPDKFYAGKNLFISNVTSWDSVWVQLEEEIPAIEKIAIELEMFYKNSNVCDKDMKREFLTTLEVGDYVVTSFQEEDGSICWYRGKVLEINSARKGEVLLHFLDYGFEEKVELRNIYPLHDYFLKYPVCAYEIGFNLKFK